MNHARRQWVDLGILEEACISRPETCASAAVAFWMRINPADGTYHGIISSEIRSGPAAFFSIYSYNRTTTTVELR